VFIKARSQFKNASHQTGSQTAGIFGGGKMITTCCFIYQLRSVSVINMFLKIYGGNSPVSPLVVRLPPKCFF